MKPASLSSPKYLIGDPDFNVMWDFFDFLLLPEGEGWDEGKTLLKLPHPSPLPWGEGKIRTRRQVLNKKAYEMKQKGFLMMEALILILIISVTFTAFTGVITQVLKISARGRALTDSIMKYEFFLFELENGFRADLLSFGGREDVEGGYQYSVQNEGNDNSYASLKSKLTWKSGKEFLEFDLVLPEAGVR